MNWTPLWFYVKISVWTTIVAVLIYGLFRFFKWRQKTFSYFKEIGINGPKPNLLWGNLAEYHGKGLVKALTEWCDKYGDVFGFLPENVAARPTIAYQPFGDGPRNCIGKRLALLEIIYTGARMVEKFKLTLGESQKDRMVMDFHAMVSSPGDGPYIVFLRL